MIENQTSLQANEIEDDEIEMQMIEDENNEKKFNISLHYPAII